MLAEDPGVVIGVDTHKLTHTAAAVAPPGRFLDHLTVQANAQGYRRLTSFGQQHGATQWAIEGTGSFGAGLTTALLSRGERVVEVDRPHRRLRRAGVKSDDVDAVRAARQALAGIGLGEPRCRGEREAIRVLLVTRGQAIEFRTRASLPSTPWSRALPRRFAVGSAPHPRSAPPHLRGAPWLVSPGRRGVRHRDALRATARRALRCEEEAAELEAQIDVLVPGSLRAFLTTWGSAQWWPLR
jgi:transposase